MSFSLVLSLLLLIMSIKKKQPHIVILAIVSAACAALNYASSSGIILPTGVVSFLRSGSYVLLLFLLMYNTWRINEHDL